MREIEVAYNEDGDMVVFDEFVSASQLGVNRNFPQTTENWIIIILTTSVILVSNVMVMWWARLKERNLIDMLVWLDCLANLSTIAVLFLAFPVRIHDAYPHWCFLIQFIRAVSMFLNR